MIFFVAITLLLKFLADTKLKSGIINFYFFLFTTLAFLPLVIWEGSEWKIPLKSLLYFVLLAFTAVIANYYSVTALAEAPNPGYVLAIQAFGIVITTLVAVFLFGSEISLIKMIGVIFSFIGLILLSW